MDDFKRFVYENPKINKVNDNDNNYSLEVCNDPNPLQKVEESNLR